MPKWPITIIINGCLSYCHNMASMHCNRIIGDSIFLSFAMTSLHICTRLPLYCVLRSVLNNHILHPMSPLYCLWFHFKTTLLWYQRPPSWIIIDFVLFVQFFSVLYKDSAREKILYCFQATWCNEILLRELLGHLRLYIWLKKLQYLNEAHWSIILSLSKNNHSKHGKPTFWR